MWYTVCLSPQCERALRCTCDAQGMHAIRNPEAYGIVPGSKHHRDVTDDCITEAKYGLKCLRAVVCTGP